jgi:hypothetical protein
MPNPLTYQALLATVTKQIRAAPTDLEAQRLLEQFAETLTAKVQQSERSVERPS